MRRTVPVLVTMGSTNNNFYSPPVYMPLEYAMRVTNQKKLEFVHPKDPKMTFNKHVEQLGTLHPCLIGDGRKEPNPNNTERGGLMGDIPPVPVYRHHIWCMGHAHFVLQHPRIFIKCPPGKVVACKWCRLKFINMATVDDCDDDWKEVEHKIATTPESEEDLNTPYRNILGVLGTSNFQDGKTPHPDVYKSVFNPEKYAWDHEEHEYEVHPAYADHKYTTLHEGH